MSVLSLGVDEVLWGHDGGAGDVVGGGEVAELGRARDGDQLHA